MNPTSRKTHFRAGFSLVELLVVIAITSVLMTMLLPVLRNARETARQSICLSLEHQQSLAFSAYLENNKEAYPYSTAARTPITPGSWLDFGQTNGTHPLTTNGPLAWWQAIAPYLQNKQLRCPSNTWSFNGNPCYGINSSGIIPGNYGSSSSSDPALFPSALILPRRSFQIIQPSRSCLLGEIPNMSISDSPYYTQYNDNEIHNPDSNSPFFSSNLPNWKSTELTRWARVSHGLAWNSLMFDGSAKVTTKATLVIYTTTSGGINTDGSRFWLNK